MIKIGFVTKFLTSLLLFSQILITTGFLADCLLESDMEYIEIYSGEKVELETEKNSESVERFRSHFFHVDLADDNFKINIVKKGTGYYTYPDEIVTPPPEFRC